MVFWRRQRSQDKTPPAEPPAPDAPKSAAEMQVRRRWTRAIGASLLWHAVFLPLVLPRLMTPAEQDIEVAYLPDVIESDDASDDKTQPDKELPDEPDRRVAKIAEPDKKKEEEKKKEKEKPLDVVKLPDLPMVDQEQFPDEKDNEKAHFLAQKNHRAAEDMQAKDRTLEKPPPADSLNAPQGEPTIAPAPTAPEQRVAELLPQPTPQPLKPVPQPMAPMQMRQPTPGGEQGEVQQLSDSGEVNPTRPGASKPGGSDGPPPLSPSRLGPMDYDKLIGSAQAQAERRAAALADRTGVPGHWDRLMAKQNALKSALENFVGNVRTGNQSELGTRKHPFAAFITQMHRQIHRYWGDGFLADLERKRDSAYPPSLITALEICVTADGNLDGIIIVKPSGSLPFDAAALDAVTSAAPFDKPPEAIKSRDGKVYLTWSFHRDERQCHPNYVDMHILTTPGKPSNKPPALATKPTAPETSEPEKPKLTHTDFTKGLPNPASASPFTKGLPNPASASPFAGRGGSGLSGGAAAAAKSAATGSDNNETATTSPPASSSKSQPGVTDAAREATEHWLSAYAKADVRWLAGASGLPFTAGGKQVADDGPALRRFFQDMLAEGVPRRERVTYYTQSQIKAKRGKLPRGGDEDDMVFAWVELAGEDMILLLSPTDRGWSVVGLDR